MHKSPYPDYFDLVILQDWRKLVGRCGMFEGYRWPKNRLPREYGLPESEVLVVAVWSFIQLPFFEQLCLIDEFTKREQS